jgi:hypothetical protein
MWKEILKGEEVHPSVKGFIGRRMSKIRQAMIKEQEEIEEAEEFMQGEIYARYPEEIKERVERGLKESKERIEKLGKLIGAKFNPQHDKFPMTVSQRLSPSTKKPKIKRMRRPQDAFSYNPDDTLDSNVMRRFNLSEKDFNEMSEESKKGFREGFKLLQGEK